MAISNQDLLLLEEKMKKAGLPGDLLSEVEIKLTQLDKLSGSDAFLSELDRFSNYIEWITGLPWQNRTTDILELEYAKLKTGF